MELELIVAMMEDALKTNLEQGIHAVRSGDLEGGLANLERANAKLNSALSDLRSVHHSGRSSPTRAS